MDNDSYSNYNASVILLFYGSNKCYMKQMVFFLAAVNYSSSNSDIPLFYVL